MSALLSLRNIHTGYGSREIVRGASLAVEGGEFCALLGLNGCGKTTLLRAACGLLAARSIYARLEGRQLPPPPVDTMCGALIQYLTTENKHFQPMGANMGILPPLPAESRPRDKRLRYMAVAERAVASFQQWLNETAL